MFFKSNDELPIKENDKCYIFLAGSIDFDTSSNWRKQVIDRFGATNCLFDPTNKHHDNLDDNQMKKHIEWELDAFV